MPIHPAKKYNFDVLFSVTYEEQSIGIPVAQNRSVEQRV
jgi:hypothetical protein